MKLIVNARVFDYETYRECAYILFDKKIIKVGDMKNMHEEVLSTSKYEKLDISEDVINVRGRFVFPSLCLCHTHMYSAFARGMSLNANPLEFKDILNQVWWKLDSKLDKTAVFQSGILSGVELLKNGVTSVIDHHASGIDIKDTLDNLKSAVCDKLGLRGVFCFETSDRFDVSECIAENIRFSKQKSDMFSSLFGMHASLSLSDETLEKIQKASNLPIHIHVAEGKIDQDDSIEKSGVGVIDRLEKYSLLRENSILAHCVHIDESDAKKIAKKGCVVAVNAMSNMNNAVGLPDFNLFKKAGIKVVIGNDGLGFNVAKDLQTLMFIAKHRTNCPSGFGLDDLKEVIDNGYNYTGKMLGVSLGRIKEGFEADFLVTDYNPPTPINAKNALGHLIFGVFDNLRPRDVVCRGEFLIKNYKFSADVDKMFEETRESAKNVWNRLEGFN